METCGVIVNCLNNRTLSGSITVVREVFTSYIETCELHDDKREIKYNYTYNKAKLVIIAHLQSCGEVHFKLKGLELCNEMNIKSKQGRIFMDCDGRIKFRQVFKYSKLNEIKGLLHVAHCRASDFFLIWRDEIESVTLTEESKVLDTKLAGRKLSSS